MSKKELIKKKFIELSKESTVHGWSHIFKTNRLAIKLMWAIFFLMSTGGSIYFISKTILDFLEYDVVTKIDVIYERKSEFPRVTFCTDPPGFEDLVDNLIINCTNNVDRSCQNIPRNFFKPTKTEDLGLCYQYNSDSNKTVYSFQAGIDFGLGVILKLNKKTIENPSLYVLIHNSSKNLLSIKDNAFRLSPGTNYYFNVNREFTYKMDYPFNDCYKDPNSFTQDKTIIDTLNKLNVLYTRETCYKFCFGLDFLKNSKCNCKADLDTVFESCLLETNNKQLSACFREYRKTFQKKDINEMCSSYCPLECNLFDFRIITSSYHLPTNGTTKIFKNFTSYEEIQKSYFSFNVYYDKLAYTVITESAKMQMADLASNIGGTCGLFIGMSFLSFLEIIQFLIEVICILKEKK